jgi:hypothetical protein
MRKTEARMAHRWSTFLLAGVSALMLVPSLAYAGAGGGPPAPGAAAAGPATTYCCATWTAVESGDRKNQITTFTGQSCTPISEADPTARDACDGRVALKCRGEFYTSPSLSEGGFGSVRRCFSP